MTDPLATTEDGEPVLHFLRRHLAGDFLLWSPNIQSEAFLNWDRLWAARTIRRGRPAPYPDGEPLPDDFTFDSFGAPRSIDELMELEFLSGLLLVVDGEVRVERYARGLDRTRRWQSSSMVKSLASILIGAAIQDGAIAGVEQPIVEWIPELEGTAYEPVRIVDLLRMASGVSWTENTNDWQTDVADNYIKAIAARRRDYVLDYVKTLPAADPAGTQYFYNTGDTLLLSYILRRATGMTAADYCSQRFWAPIGCERDGFFILESDEGHEVVGSCCGATLRDYAKWGTFMLDDGVIDGTRVVPEGWVAESTAPSSPNFAPDMAGRRGLQPDTPPSEFTGYGYLWWLRSGGDYQALGSYGQWIYVSPSARTVAVLLGAVPRSVYMSPAQLAQHAASEHLGSEMRTDFVKAAIAAT